MGTARLPNWRRKACADFDAGQNIPLLHYSHDNRTFYARFCWVGRLTAVHGRDVIPCSLLCSQAGRRLSKPFMRRPSRMLRPRREMFAAPAASSRACTRLLGGRVAIEPVGQRRDVDQAFLATLDLPSAVRGPVDQPKIFNTYDFGSSFLFHRSSASSMESSYSQRSFCALCARISRTTPRQAKKPATRHANSCLNSQDESLRIAIKKSAVNPHTAARTE